MTLQEFIRHYDFEGAIVLLEGKRNVPVVDQEKLAELGRILALASKKMLFRSGNADGADHYFSAGVASVEKNRLQVIVPYAGHRSKTMQAYESISLDTVNLAAENDVVYYSKHNSKNTRLIDQYLTGDVNRNSIKAAYIIRDTVKVIGTSSIKPASFGIFYDDLQNPKTGGTGHTMNVCQQNNIPFINQNIWFDWIKSAQFFY
jgi:hypothetical protein